MMSRRYLPRIVLTTFVGLAVFAFLAFALGGTGTEARPESPAEANATTAVDDGREDVAALEVKTEEAIGFSTAARNLAVDLAKAPFSIELPKYVTEGLAIERYNLMVSGNDATLDVIYTIPVDKTAAWRPAVHIWQTNRGYEIPDRPLQQTGGEGTLSARGLSWRYWLLTYPQPVGGVLEMYAAEATAPDGISFAVDIRVGMDPTLDQRDAALKELERVLESLQPFNN